MPPRLVDLFEDSAVLQWSGDLLGGGARAVLPIAGSDDSIVLVGWSAPSHSLRSRLCSPRGSLSMTISAPSLPPAPESALKTDAPDPL